MVELENPEEMRKQKVAAAAGCPFVKYPGSHFCKEDDHKRSYDNMLYQRRSRKDVTGEQRAAFDEEMKFDATAGRHVAEFLQDNLPEQKRKSLVEFAKVERIQKTTRRMVFVGDFVVK